MNAKARKVVESLKSKCESLKTQRDQSSRNAIVFARPGDRAAHNQAIKNLEKCQKDLKAARKKLEVDLPEQARRAGVPPGWLR